MVQLDRQSAFKKSAALHFNLGDKVLLREAAVGPLDRGVGDRAVLYRVLCLRNPNVTFQGQINRGGGRGESSGVRKAVYCTSMFAHVCFVVGVGGMSGDISKAERVHRRYLEEN